MFAQVHHPQSLRIEELDQYLVQGWFRMGQTIFTTNFLHFKNEFYSAIWLRVWLPDFIEDSTQKKLFKRNASFTVTIQPAIVTAEKEMLFALYKQSVTFEASASLDQLLYGKTGRNIYNTYEIVIHDGDALVGVGFFDLGKDSAEGISSFYDPAYKKYSLGKYLIYLKMNYCKQLGLKYFYPGYFVPGYSYFDYKLDIGKASLQYFNITAQRWLPVQGLLPENIPYRVMQQKLTFVQQLLAEAGIESRILKYEYFDANLIPDLKDAALFDYPLFLSWQTGDSIDVMVVYDSMDEQYHLITCINIWKPETTKGTEGIFSSYLIKMSQDLYQTQSPQDLVLALTTTLTR